MKHSAAIKAISSHLPVGILTNQQLGEEFGDVDANSILVNTGIARRHIAAAGECASDLGVVAANKLFDSGLITRDEIDFLVLCTQTPDYLLPTTACIMQDRLGLRTDCGAIDINQGCSGYVYGLAVAKSLVETGLATNLLLITADTYSKLINPRDRTIRTLFGDGATATLISSVSSDEELIGPFIFGTDGRGENELIVPAGGMRRPIDDSARIAEDDGSGNWRSPSDLHMNGGEVFNFTLRTIPPLLDQFLQKCGLSMDDIDLFVPHQANKFMLERLRRKLKIPVEKFCIDLEESGNTVSSTIPLALENALARGQIGAGQRAILFGFGVGYSWGATMLRIGQ